MSKNFKVTVVSANRQLFEGAVQQIVATAETGEIGVLAGHAPLLASLKAGQIRLIDESGSEQVIYASGGFLEIQPSQVIILADDAERAEMLDEAKVQQARDEALARMKDKSLGRLELDEVEIKLMQSLAKLSTIRRAKRN